MSSSIARKIKNEANKIAIQKNRERVWWADVREAAHKLHIDITDPVMAELKRIWDKGTPPVVKGATPLVRTETWWEGKPDV